MTPKSSRKCGRRQRSDWLIVSFLTILVVLLIWNHKLLDNTLSSDTELAALVASLVPSSDNNAKNGTLCLQWKDESPINELQDKNGKEEDENEQEEEENEQEEEAATMKPKPNNKKPSDQEPFYFAGCLMLKDDNKLLPEWLAYHYQVLPMRRLIIGIDPFNYTSVDYIVDRYRSLLDMDITILLEDEYTHDFYVHGRPEGALLPNATGLDHTRAYIWRQQALYTKCADVLRQEGHTWTVFLDTDEYLIFNRYHSHNEPGFAECLLPIGKGVNCADEMKLALTFNQTHVRSKLPFVGESTIAKYMHENKDELWEDYLQYGCMIVPRIPFGFGGVDFNHELDVSSRLGVPKGFDPQDFLTLLSRYHYPMANPPNAGKSITNLQVSKDFKVRTPHIVCKHRKRGKNFWDKHAFDSKSMAFPYVSKAIFRINHYLGHKETFMRVGKAQTKDDYQYTKRGKKYSVGPNQDAQGWLQAFVENVGHDIAHKLTAELRQWAYRTDAEALSRLNINKRTAG